MASDTDRIRNHGSGESQLIRDLLASVPAAVAYVAGPNMIFEFANEDYRRAVGRRDLIGLPYPEALPEIVGEPRFEALRRVLRTGEPCRLPEEEVRIKRTKTGLEPIYVETVYQPVRDESGQIAGVLLFGIDVTEHVQSRRRLQETADQLMLSEARYRTLFETLPQGVIHYGRDGSVLEANPAAEQILGIEAAAMTPANCARLILHEDGTPYQPGDLPSMSALRTGEIVSGVITRIRSNRTGEERWVRVVAVPEERDSGGRPQRAYSVFSDFTQQYEAEASLRESNRLLGLLREANVLGVAVASEEGILEANDAFLDIVGYTRDDLTSGRLTWDVITPAEWAQVEEDAVQQLRRTGSCPPYEKEQLHRDGRRVPTLVGAAVLSRNPLRWAKFVVDLTARQRSEEDRAALLAREQAARLEAVSAQERLALLLGAGDLLVATTSQGELLDQVAHLMVPTLADHSVVYLPTAQGMLRAVSVVDRDMARAGILEGLRQVDIPAAGPLIPQTAFTRGTTQLVADVSDTIADMSSPVPEVAQIIQILRRVQFASALATPLLVGQHPVGVLVLGRSEGRPRFTETDMSVITELARRLGAGLANVETFAREHTVAETLQHALLPDTLQEIAGLELAVHYLPATGGVQVGGDWYDVFHMARGQVGLAIGDVAGHSISSASVMGQIRSLLRAYALEHKTPADVLRRTNAAVCHLLPDVVATAFYAVLDLSTGDLAYANAGHPPPMLDNGDGDAERLDRVSDAMLGASADTEYSAIHRRLPSEARLLLYTDGLIESRKRDITEGLEALDDAMRHSAAQTAEETCQFVQKALLGTGPRADDVCILAIRLANGASGA